VSWGDALELGIAAGTMSRWVRSGRVRSRGKRDRREYLRRDLVILVARKRAGSITGTVPCVELKEGDEEP
jgi:predicted site-specific integrase-resolvase